MSADRLDQSNPAAQVVTIPNGVAALTELYYQELKKIAKNRRKQEGEHTLNTTVLVHDLYLQMRARGELEFERPAQFYAYAAKAMRHMLTDRARAKSRAKAGGDQVQVSLDSLAQTELPSVEMRAIDLDSAIQKLESIDEKSAQVVELHFFGGQSFDQIAELLDCSRRTVFRNWEFARAFLLKQLK